MGNGHRQDAGGPWGAQLYGRLGDEIQGPTIVETDVRVAAPDPLERQSEAPQCAVLVNGDELTEGDQSGSARSGAVCRHQP
jgi:hypothetical protein